MESANMPLDKYIKEKIKMLRRDFRMNLTEADIEHFNLLSTEIEVDNFAHKLFFERL